MRIFLDTSTLFKLYHRESGTVELEVLFTTEKITTIFLSEITKIEFASSIWKKVRMGDVSLLEASMTLRLFENDFGKYTFITLDSIVIEQARILSSKYGTKGLRTLDGIQLSTAVLLSKQSDLFLTADKLLNTFFEEEGLQTTI
ncbi:type II toxin-antitoxin system VapC family toxin [Haliscomenobacter sp.]|uniref:type II toxin-antitoxin system VapC family toxin n=1 Tax=Haliscomenobacter sp. TaxID=2717303 RepID=UPI003364EE15